MRENAYQNNSEYGHFLSNVDLKFVITLLRIPLESKYWISLEQDRKGFSNCTIYLEQDFLHVLKLMSINPLFSSGAVSSLNFTFFFHCVNYASQKQEFIFKLAHCLSLTLVWFYTFSFLSVFTAFCCSLVLVLIFYFKSGCGY